LVLGLVGRVYGDGRKGEDIVERLAQDEEVMKAVELVSMNESWGVPVIGVDSYERFYALIDYLLIPSRVEGGPVPVMEALACGKLSIAPPIGVIPSFPHIEYKTGDYEDLKKTLMKLSREYQEKKSAICETVKSKNWERWAFEHDMVFLKMVKTEAQASFHRELLDKTEEGKTIANADVETLANANAMLRAAHYEEAINAYMALRKKGGIYKVLAEKNLEIARARQKGRKPTETAAS
jgi:hypothetical protein